MEDRLLWWSITIYAGQAAIYKQDFDVSFGVDGELIALPSTSITHGSISVQLCMHDSLAVHPEKKLIKVLEPVQISKHDTTHNLVTAEKRTA